MSHAAASHKLADRISRTFGSNQQMFLIGDLVQFVAADGLITVKSKAVLRLPLHAKNGNREWPRFHLRELESERPRGEPDIDLRCSDLDGGAHCDHPCDQADKPQHAQ